MNEMINGVNYGEWDREGFVVPVRISEQTMLHEALETFYTIGGFDFFQVMNPEKYADSWLDYVGDLYGKIENGYFMKDGLKHVNPLGKNERRLLMEQGVPEVFWSDISR